MNKTERLILLLQHLNSEDRVSLKDISNAYNVSERTVYRDLNTLSNLGFAINQEDGYSVESKNAAGCLDQFNETEIRLIIFALKTNILGKLFPFEELAVRIERMRLSKKTNSS